MNVTPSKDLDTLRHIGLPFSMDNLPGELWTFLDDGGSTSKRVLLQHTDHFGRE
jgi:hypothetical protein